MSFDGERGSPDQVEWQGSCDSFPVSHHLPHWIYGDSDIPSPLAVPNQHMSVCHE